MDDARLPCLPPHLHRRADLVGSTDAVQYSIRLLLPSGSLLLTRQDPVLEEAVSAAAASAEEKAAPGAAGSAVTFSASSAWRHGDPRIDALQRALSSVVEADADGVRSDDETFADIWALCRDAGAPLTADPPRPDPRLAASLPGPERPRLSEAWFCCAEPTMNQIDLVEQLMAKPKMAEKDLAALGNAHEWVSIDDPDENRTWLVDVTFLESGWRCIYLNGCQGVLTGPAPELQQGCCSYGAHLTGDEDADRVGAAALTLTAEQWQFRQKGRSKRGVIYTNSDGEPVDPARRRSVHLPQPAGVRRRCRLRPAPALRSSAASSRSRLKPDVCWQLPLRRSDEVAADGHVTSTLAEWRRRHWGEGGHEFHWWCTEAPEAFGSQRPVYETMRAEIVAITGDKVYELIGRYLAARSRLSVRLPHPAVRRR